MPVYWQPQFHPGRAVSDDWDAKIGNGVDGWGNQELQHYTAGMSNVFLQALPLLPVVLRSCPQHRRRQAGHPGHRRAVRSGPR